MTKRSKPGAKPLPAAKRRSESIMVRVTAAEKELIVQRAAKQPLAAFLRDRALAS